MSSWDENQRDADGLGRGWLEGTLELAELAGVRDQERTLNVIRNVALCGDREAGSIVQEALRRQAVQATVDGNPFFPPPTREQLAGMGGFQWGVCAMSGCPHLMHDPEPAGNGVIAGTVGAAKTTAICHLALNANRAGNIVHIDIPRGDCRCLVKYHGFRLANTRTYRFNVLGGMRNVPRAVLAQELAAMFAHHFALQTRGKMLTARWIFQVYERFGSQGHEPCVADLVSFLRHARFEKRSYEAECAMRVIERLESCIDYSGDMLLCERGHPVEEIPDPLVFEMSGLDPQLRDFLFEARIQREYLFRQYNPEASRSGMFEFVDESLNTSRERRYSSSSREMSIATMDVTVTQARYYRMRIVVATQLPSALSAAFKGTAVLRMAGNMLPSEIPETARQLGLDMKQAEWLRKVPRGTFVARHAVARLPDPYLLAFPLFPGLDERIPEDEAQEIAERSMADLPWKPRWEGYQQDVRERSPDVVERVYRRIAEHGDEDCSERCKALEIDTATESSARRDLSADGGRGLIEQNGRVGNLLFFCLTPKGRSVAEERGYKVWKNHASAAHAYIVRRCRVGLGQVGRLRIPHREFAVGHRRPDGLFDFQGRCVAIQVASSANYSREAEALLELSEASGIDMAVLVGTHKRHAAGIRKALAGKVSDVGWERIAVLDAAEVLKPSFDWRTVVGDL